MDAGGTEILSLEHAVNGKLEKAGIFTQPVAFKASKYKQIVNHVLSGIMDKKYKNGDKIPSINEFCERYHLSRDTVFSGIKELKSKGIIDSAPGIGYYVVSTRISFERNIFLLFNEFTEFKEDLYKSFIKAVGKTATVNLFFHYLNH
jgi:DNA-binding GntR family transcriptional regulator